MNKIWLKIILVSCCFFQASTNAESVNIELKYYSKASYYLGQGKFKLAANQWHQLSVVFLRSEAKLGNRKMWQYAGLAEALAAISADKTNDIVAYQYWADSGRYLMTGGTNWSLVQKQLHQRFETTNTQLSAFMQVNDLAANDSDKWQQDLTLLQIWHDKLSVFTFTSPKLGLSGTVNAVKVSQQQPSVHYKGSLQQGKKLSGLGVATFRGNQMTPVKPQLPVADLSQSSNPKVPAVEFLPLVEINEIELKTNIKKVLKSTQKVNTNQIQENPLSRGNMATIKEESVEALQRRSFAPVIKK